MKKVRVFLAASVALFAFGAAYASTLATIGYRYIPASGGSPAVCRQLTSTDNCSTSVTVNPCLAFDATDAATVQIKQNTNIATQCGPSLYKINP